MPPPPPPPPPPAGAAAGASSASSSRQRAAKDVVDVLNEMSLLLHTGLDRTTLSLCISLIENGVNPEALATIIKELRRESSALGLAEPH